MIKLLQNKGKRYKQYNLSHKKKLPVCVAKTIRLTFGFVLTALLLLLSIISLNSARLVRDADLYLQKALKFQLHRCHINLRRKNHFRRMNSALNYPNSHLSLDRAAIVIIKLRNRLVPLVTSQVISYC